MNPFLVVVLFFVSFTLPLSFAQDLNIDCEFVNYTIPINTYQALEKYLDQRGDAAKNAMDKLPKLNGVSKLSSVTVSIQSGRRGSSNGKDFIIDADPLFTETGAISVNFGSDLLPSKHRTAGVVNIIPNEPTVLTSWEDSKGRNIIVSFLTGQSSKVVDVAKVDLEQCKVVVRVLEFAHEENDLSAEEAIRKGKSVYQQTVYLQSGVRWASNWGEKMIEYNPVFSADKKEMDIIFCGFAKWSGKHSFFVA